MREKKEPLTHIHRDCDRGRVTAEKVSSSTLRCGHRAAVIGLRLRKARVRHRCRVSHHPKEAHEVLRNLTVCISRKRQKSVISVLVRDSMCNFRTYDPTDGQTVVFSKASWKHSPASLSLRACAAPKHIEESPPARSVSFQSKSNALQPSMPSINVFR